MRTTVETGSDIGAEGGERAPRDDRVADRGLNGDLEELAGDDFDCGSPWGYALSGMWG